MERWHAWTDFPAADKKRIQELCKVEGYASVAQLLRSLVYACLKQNSL